MIALSNTKDILVLFAFDESGFGLTGWGILMVLMFAWLIGRKS